MRIDLKKQPRTLEKMSTLAYEDMWKVKRGKFILVISFKFFTYYDNITENFSLKLVRYNNLSLLFMILSISKKKSP